MSNIDPSMPLRDAVRAFLLEYDSRARLAIALLEHLDRPVAQNEAQSDTTTHGSALYVIRHVSSQLYFTSNQAEPWVSSLSSARKFLSSTIAREILRGERLVGRAQNQPYEIVPVVEERRWIACDGRAERA